MLTTKGGELQGKGELKGEFVNDRKVELKGEFLDDAMGELKGEFI